MDYDTRIKYLRRFSKAFRIEVVPTVFSEINRKSNSDAVNSDFTLLSIDSFLSRNGPILAYLMPVFGKGEYEVISVAFSYCIGGMTKFLAILDDSEARNIVIRHIPALKANLMGTVGLIGHCNYNVNLFNSLEAITILSCIKKSPFRVSDKIVDDIIIRVADGGKNV